MNIPSIASSIYNFKKTIEKKSKYHKKVKMCVNHLPRIQIVKTLPYKTIKITRT